MKQEEINLLNDQLQIDLNSSLQMNFLSNPLQKNMLIYCLTFILSFVVFVILFNLTIKNIPPLNLILYSLGMSTMVTISTMFIL